MMKCLLALLLIFTVDSMAGEGGKRHFEFDQWAGPTMNVFVTRPPGMSPDRPVVFVMHGMSRNADDYRDQWHELAIEHDFLLVVPEFSRRNFPGSRAYNLGNITDETGSPIDPSLWSFAAIEPLFDDVLKRFSLATSKYAIYGHSAGSQFVHRFLMHVPDARVSSAVVANAGWYTLPDFTSDYPVGLRGSMVARENLAPFFARKLTVLLGDRDTDPNDDSLRRNDEVNVQGAHRLARGHYFFSGSRQLASGQGLQFSWQLAEVAGVDHNNRLMAPYAVDYLLGR